MGNGRAIRTCRSTLGWRSVFSSAASVRHDRELAFAPGLQLFGRCLIKTKVIAAAAVLGITALASWSPPANAAGCLKGALIGGLAGHFAGHGILGAGAGCLGSVLNSGIPREAVS